MLHLYQYNPISNIHLVLTYGLHLFYLHMVSLLALINLLYKETQRHQQSIIADGNAEFPQPSIFEK